MLELLVLELLVLELLVLATQFTGGVPFLTGVNIILTGIPLTLSTSLIYVLISKYKLIKRNY